MKMVFHENCLVRHWKKKSTKKYHFFPFSWTSFLQVRELTTHPQSQAQGANQQENKGVCLPELWAACKNLGACLEGAKISKHQDLGGISGFGSRTSALPEFC